jgi:hypothetical protein
MQVGRGRNPAQRQFQSKQDLGLETNAGAIDHDFVMNGTRGYGVAMAHDLSYRTPPVLPQVT